MARDKLYSANNDMTPGGSSILLSLVQGEQLELPCVLDIWVIADNSYLIEAVVIEGENDASGSIPTTHKSGATPRTLTYRIPAYKNQWNNASVYETNDVVYDDGEHYRLFRGSNYSDNVKPSDNPLWLVHDPRTIYVQFPSDLSGSGVYTPWEMPTTAERNIYGFFELSITEPAFTSFRRIWKPVRGLVELLFSPTELN